MSKLEPGIIDNKFLDECKKILSQIDKNPKILVQQPLFLDDNAFPFQFQYKNLFFEAGDTSELISLLKVYVYFTKKKLNVFKENSLFQIEIAKKLKISSENIIGLKKTFNTYQNIKKKYPKIDIKNKLINQKLCFYTNLYNTDFITNQLAELGNEIKEYSAKRKQIAEIISKFENDFSFTLEKDNSDNVELNKYILTYKNLIFTDKNYKALLDKLKNTIKLLIEFQNNNFRNLKIKLTRSPKIFIVGYRNHEIIGDNATIIHELKLLIKYKTVQLSLNFK